MKNLVFIFCFLSFLTFGQETKRNLCTEKSIIGLVSFGGGTSTPVLNVFCNAYGSITIERVFEGVYRIVPTVPFEQGQTWLYISSEAFGSGGSVGREIQIQLQPDGSLYILTYQNSQHSDIVIDDVSFEIRVYD